MTNRSVPPIPSTISPEAQAVLAAAAQTPSMPDPKPDDEQGWQQLGAIAATTDPGTATALALATTGAVIDDVATTVEQRSAAGAKYFVATPDSLPDDDSRVLFFIHGGGFTFGGGASAERSTGLLAGNYGVRTWGMDYRQLPDHAYPAGLDDCMAVYRELLKTTDASKIAIGGQSGGANLTAALLLRVHREGLPLPAVAALISPPIDLTESGDTYQTNRFTIGEDGLANVFARYSGDASLEDPLVSPFFGEFTADFPPVILTAGTRDFLLSDTVRMHRKLLASGVRAELHVWEGAPHGLFMGRAPEDREQVAQIREFFEAAWNSSVSD